MFDHRLGLALGCTLSEIRAIPYPEWYSWSLYFKLEPWGFADDEYQTAAILTMLHNINNSRKKQKPVEYFIRDMLKAVLESLAEKPDPDTLTREQLLQMVRQDFGL